MLKQADGGGFSESWEEGNALSNALTDHEGDAALLGEDAFIGGSGNDFLMLDSESDFLCETQTKKTTWCFQEQGAERLTISALALGSKGF